MFNILIIIATLSGLSVVIIFARQFSFVRRGEVSALKTQSLGELIQQRVDNFYHQFSYFFRQLLHYLYFYSLVIGRFLIMSFRFLLIRVERKFSYLIETTRRNKHINRQKGQVSFFLSRLDIKGVGKQASVSQGEVVE